MCRESKVAPDGVADDAIFAKTGHGAGLIADEFLRKGVYFYPAKKADRLAGWNIMRRYLANAVRYGCLRQRHEAFQVELSGI